MQERFITNLRNILEQGERAGVADLRNWNRKDLCICICYARTWFQKECCFWFTV